MAAGDYGLYRNNAVSASRASDQELPIWDTVVTETDTAVIQRQSNTAIRLKDTGYYLLMATVGMVTTSGGFNGGEARFAFGGTADVTAGRALTLWSTQSGGADRGPIAISRLYENTVANTDVSVHWNHMNGSYDDEAGASSLLVLKLDDTSPFLRLSLSTVVNNHSGENNSAVTYTDLDTNFTYHEVGSSNAWSQDDVDTGFSVSGSSITFANAGLYLVTFGGRVLGFAGTTRGSLQGRLTQAGTALDGSYFNALNPDALNLTQGLMGGVMLVRTTTTNVVMKLEMTVESDGATNGDLRSAWFEATRLIDGSGGEAVSVIGDTNDSTHDANEVFPNGSGWPNTDFNIGGVFTVPAAQKYLTTTSAGTYLALGHGVSGRTSSHVNYKRTVCQIAHADNAAPSVLNHGAGGTLCYGGNGSSDGSYAGSAFGFGVVDHATAPTEARFQVEGTDPDFGASANAVWIGETMSLQVLRLDSVYGAAPATAVKDIIGGGFIPFAR